MPYADFSLDGRVVLITGAASGIGQAIAVGAAEHGAKLALLARPGRSMTETLDLISPTGAATLCVEADTRDAAALDAAVARTEAELGPLWGAVNSAGIAGQRQAEDMPESQWQEMIDINLTGVLLSCQAEGRAMLAHDGGSIVNISSMSGVIINRGLSQAHYSSAKAAVTHLSRALAMEWAQHRVRVNALSPGYTLTPMNTRTGVSPELRAEFAYQTPLGRLAEPYEMAGPAVFLLSDAASYITGIDLLVDGGYTAW